MIKNILNFLGLTLKDTPPKYSGLSDFLRNASSEERNEVFMEAARGANEDQLKVLKEAQLKTKAN